MNFRLHSSVLKVIPVLSMVLLVFACGHKHDPVLEEAAAIHNEAVDVEGTISDRIAQLIDQRNGLATQGRELTEEEWAFASAVDRIESTYGWWQENHVEVPGYHDHDHSKCDGHHGPGLEVASEDMLLIQKEFRDSILVLQELVNNLSMPAVPAPVE